MDIIDFLANDNYIIVNKDIAKLYGLEEAVILGELASEHKYWQKNGGLKDGYFYSTIENIEKNTTILEKRQRLALNSLKEQGIIDIKRMDIPAKRYIKINTEKLLSLFIDNIVQIGETSSVKMAELEQSNQPTKNNIKNNNDNNKIKEKISKKEIDIEFESIWQRYPNKKGKEGAYKSYAKARTNGTTYDEVIIGLENYLKEIKVKKTDNQYIKYGSTWFSQHCWNDEYVTTVAAKPNSFDTTMRELAEFVGEDAEFDFEDTDEYRDIMGGDDNA
jgi:hypothetical protein